MPREEGMTLEENKKLVLDHYEALYRQDAEAVRRQLAADFVDHEAPFGSTPPGPEAVLRAFETVHQAFPDLSVKIEDIVAEGDLVAVRGTWTGTHKGPAPFMSFPPTNRATAASGMVFWRIRDGQIVERWGNLDRLGLQRQLSAQS